MTSPWSPAQLGLLLLALERAASPPEDGDPNDFAVLTRAGLLREWGDGRYVATEAGLRYGASVLDDPPSA